MRDLFSQFPIIYLVKLTIEEHTEFLKSNSCYIGYFILTKNVFDSNMIKKLNYHLYIFLCKLILLDLL